MPPPDDLSSLRDVEHSVTLILGWTAGLDEQAFLDDELVESAVYRQLSIIGEAIRRLSDGFRAAHTEVDWRGWTDFRNVKVHAYDTVDGSRV